MLYPVGAQVPFACQYTNNKAGAAGLTVTCSVARLNSDGTITAVVTGASATEIDATNLKGVYAYQLAGASTGTAGVYLAVFHTAGTVDEADLAALEIVGAAWVQDVDAPISGVAAAVWAAATRTLTALGFAASGSVTLLGPPLTGGTLTLVRGGAYTAALGSSLSWTLDGTAPDLTGATVSLEVGVPGLAAAITAAITVSGPASAQVLTVADVLSATTTALDPAASYRFTIWQTRDGGTNRSALVQGPVTVTTLP